MCPLRNKTKLNFFEVYHFSSRFNYRSGQFLPKGPQHVQSFQKIDYGIPHNNWVGTVCVFINYQFGILARFTNSMQQLIISLRSSCSNSVVNKLKSNWLQFCCPTTSNSEISGYCVFQDYKYKKLKIISVMSVWSNCKLLFQTVFSILKGEFVTGPTSLYQW